MADDSANSNTAGSTDRRSAAKHHDHVGSGMIAMLDDDLPDVAG